MIKLIAEASSLAVECQNLLNAANTARTNEEAKKYLTEYQKKMARLAELKEKIKAA